MENKKDRNEIWDFYNNFSLSQIRTGVNLRHYTVMSNCVKAGLKRNDHILVDPD